MTVHLVYPHRRVGTAPDVIGWRVADALAQDNRVLVYEWDTVRRAQPQQGDVLIGHPHPIPGTVLRRSWPDPRWARRIVLAPYSGDLQMVAFEDALIRTADAYLAITGRPWFEAMSLGPVAHWASRAVQLDLAVDQVAYPRVKSDFGSPGARRFLYIGHTADIKNPQYLEALAAALVDHDFGWIGSGRPLRGFRRHGWIRSDSGEARRVVSDYDFLVMVGRDANPAVVLEAMSWGLIPVTTPTAGYVAEDGVVELPVNDVGGAVEVLQRLQKASQGELQSIRQRNDELLRTRYTWDRFTEIVRHFVAEGTSRGPVDTPENVRALLRTARFTSPLVRDVGAWARVVRQAARREGAGVPWPGPS